MQAMRIYGLLLLVGLHQIAVADDINRFAHDKMRWGDLEYQAKVFFVSTTSDIHLQIIKAVAAAKVLLDVDGKDLIKPSGENVISISTYSESFGKKTRYQVWFDFDGRVMQKARTLRGNKNEKKMYRYTDCGYYSFRQRFNKENFTSALINWAQVKKRYHAYRTQCNHAVITESNALLYLVPAMEFGKVGDSHELLVESRSHIARIKLTAVDKKTLRSSYHIKDQGKTRTVKNPTVLKIKLTSRDASNSNNASFEFLGLSGDIYLYVDIAERVISRLNGDIDVIGNIDIDLTKMTVTR